MADNTITLETAEADERQRKLMRWLGPRETAKAGAAAINRAGRAARTVGSREVRKELRVKARDVKDRMSVVRATPSRLEYRIDFDYSQLPLIMYGSPRQTRRGVSVTIKRGGGRTTIPHAFISPQHGGQVVIRTKKADGEGLVPKTPVRRAYGPSIGSQLDRAEPAMDARAEEVLADRLTHELEWRVEKANL